MAFRAAFRIAAGSPLGESAWRAIGGAVGIEHPGDARPIDAAFLAQAGALGIALGALPGLDFEPLLLAHGRLGVGPADRAEPQQRLDPFGEPMRTLGGADFVIVPAALEAAAEGAERGKGEADVELVLPADDSAAADDRHALALQRDGERCVDLEVEPAGERKVPGGGEAVDIAGAQRRGALGHHRHVGEIVDALQDEGTQLIGRARRHADRFRRGADHPGARERGDEGDLAVRRPAGGVGAGGDVGREMEEEFGGVFHERGSRCCERKGNIAWNGGCRKVICSYAEVVRRRFSLGPHLLYLIA